MAGETCRLLMEVWVLAAHGRVLLCSRTWLCLHLIHPSRPTPAKGLNEDGSPLFRRRGCFIRHLSSFSLKCCAAWQLLCACYDYVKAWGAIKGL